MNKLKEIRKAKGYSASGLSQATGLSMQTIYFLENEYNDIAEIKLSTLTKLCNVLETTPYCLIGDKELLSFTRDKFCKKYKEVHK